MHYNDEKVLWWKRGTRPPAVPKCGFDGLQCPENVFKAHLGWFISAIILVVLLALVGVAAVIYSIRVKKLEEDRLNRLWQISFTSLDAFEPKGKAENSVRSLRSTTNSGITKRDVIAERRNFTFFILDGTLVAARKHECFLHPGSKEFAHWRAMRQFDQENLNRFIGLCSNGPQMLSLWKYCSRGSIDDVIENNAAKMDSFFAISFMRDIASAIAFLHESQLQVHGFLTSKNCLVSERWQVKVSDYGLDRRLLGDKLPTEDLLWTAPEHLRSDTFTTSKEGDIFSFAIVSAQLLTKTKAWDLAHRKEDPDEIIYMVKKGGYNALRPDLDTEPTEDTAPALLHLVRDCWAERPSERPEINQVRHELRSMKRSGGSNLMDYVFNMLESYASTLEQEVDERMKELVMEKKKIDIILHKMLPKEIAEKLKMGQSVEPESYESVTVLFSDVVSFTEVAQKSSPFQVVTLLNQLYSTFDGIIDEHDVYKVETIRDAYLCVSGLPRRNGIDHITEICDMSLEFLKSIVDLRIPHLPEEKLSLRIGLHSGSVVAGVVGHTMPRYCLFGDTVNTASRMQSNGKPGMIHLSSAANELLDRVGGYRTEKRGEMIIKGKGVMETYWLIGKVTES
ncbi:hypothetical protein Q1695_013178 [Nippostrongylus brasiliensis]|nr:hypothetical protein Q1695_013178 [Nippostrongylus brasiliensis]